MINVCILTWSCHWAVCHKVRYNGPNRNSSRALGPQSKHSPHSYSFRSWWNIFFLININDCPEHPNVLPTDTRAPHVETRAGTNRTLCCEFYHFDEFQHKYWKTNIYEQIFGHVFCSIALHILLGKVLKHEFKLTANNWREWREVGGFRSLNRWMEIQTLGAQQVNQIVKKLKLSILLYLYFGAMQILSYILLSENMQIGRPPPYWGWKKPIIVFMHMYVHLWRSVCVCMCDIHQHFHAFIHAFMFFAFQVELLLIFGIAT